MNKQKLWVIWSIQLHQNIIIKQENFITTDIIIKLGTLHMILTLFVVFNLCITLSTNSINFFSFAGT